MFIPPYNLLPYVDFEEGKIIAVNLPDNLKDEFEKLKKIYKELEQDRLTDY